MAVDTDISEALTELIAEFGETVRWRPHDRPDTYTFPAYVTNNTVIVLKETLTALVANRAPENGDTILNDSGVEMQVASVNGAYDQVIDGGFSEQSTLRSGNQTFYRIVCAPDIRGG